jgi:hypothetical protein
VRGVRADVMISRLANKMNIFITKFPNLLILTSPFQGTDKIIEYKPVRGQALLPHNFFGRLSSKHLCMVGA